MEHQLLQKPKQKDAIAPKRQAASEGNTRASGTEPALGKPSKEREQGMWNNMLAGVQSQGNPQSQGLEQHQSQANGSGHKVTKTVKMRAKKTPIAEPNLEHLQTPQSGDKETDKIARSSVTSTSSNSLEKEIAPAESRNQRIRNIIFLPEGEATLTCFKIPFQGTRAIWELELDDQELTMWHRELDFNFSSGDRIVSSGLIIPPGPVAAGQEFTQKQENEVRMKGEITTTGVLPFKLYIDEFTVRC